MPHPEAPNVLSPILLHFPANKKYYAGQYVHYCPACKQIHPIAVDLPFSNGAKWSFNGDPERPTFSPSVNNMTEYQPGKRHVCHYFIREGMIDYCGDCTHDLAGKKVPLPPIPDSVLGNWALR